MAVMVYKVRDELKCACPGFSEDGAYNLTRCERLRLGLATQFLRDLFSLEVNEQEKHLYRITQTLVTDLVDYPETVWYPGVKAHGDHVAIKGAHLHRLHLSSVKIIDSVTVNYSADAKRYDIRFQLLRSYDENLVDNTQPT